MSGIEVPGFEIIEKVGEGGMAAVWKARQVSLDRIVAIKVLSARLATDPEDVERFQAEARAAARLKHPGIVQVHDARFLGGLYYFVMEFIAGYTVGDWLRRKGVLPEADALLVAECVTDALGYAWNAAQIIHCDIKPDNVMVDADGTVKVADLGLARTISSMNVEEGSDEVMGTPAYMAPEQVSGSAALDCRTDIYALGAMLYHLVTGKMLFEGETEDRIMELQLAGTVENPYDANPALSLGLCRLIERMLAKDPQARPQTWEEVRADIAHVRRGRPGSLTVPGAACTVREATRPRTAHHHRHHLADAMREASLGAPRKRRGHRAASVCLALALLGALGFGAWWLHRSRQTTALPAAPVVHAPSPAPSRAAPVPVPAPEAGAPRGKQELDRAREWVQSHPGKYREALGRLASALEAARGTPYEGTAAQALRQLSDEANAATRKKMEELDAQAAPLTDAGQFLEAAAVFENYDGPLAEETAGRRRAAAAALRARKTAADAAERGRESAAREKYTRTLDQVAETLLKEGIIAACSAVRDILGDQDLQRFQAELGAVRQLLEATAKINVRVLDSFRQQSGQTITVQLKNGAFSGTVAGVGETFVTLAIRLPVGEGRSERSFGVDDLAAKERLARLGPDGAPEVALAKGLMAAEAQAIESAASFFSSVGPPLGEVLVAKMRARGAKSSAAGSTEPSAQAEGEGAQRPPEPPRPIRLPPDLEAVRGNAAAVMSLLRRRNPALDEESIRTQAGEGGRINAIEIRSRSLTDLGPLAALPDLKSLSCGDPSAEEPSELKDVTPLRYTRLEQLSIVNAKLSDISALRTVPLQALCLARTQVREVSALRGMQLRHLELQGTRLFEGLPLAGLPLQYLDISGTQIKSISFTKGMPLETLLLADTGIYDFSLVPGLPVRELSLSDTQFRDLAMLKETGVRRLHLANGRFSSLAPLRGMNLEYLDVSGTRVTDFSSLAGMKLQTFIAANSALASLSFLSGMPLTTLIVPGTRVSDLDPIGDLSLTYLDISDTAVTDLAPLRGVPLVTLLCRNIPACNFGALRECPLQELYVDKPMRFMELLRQFPDLRLVNGESIEGLRGMRPRWRDPVNR